MVRHCVIRTRLWRLLRHRSMYGFTPWYIPRKKPETNSDPNRCGGDPLYMTTKMTVKSTCTSWKCIARIKYCKYYISCTHPFLALLRSKTLIIPLASMSLLVSRTCNWRPWRLTWFFQVWMIPYNRLFKLLGGSEKDRKYIHLRLQVLNRKQNQEPNDQH